MSELCSGTVKCRAFAESQEGLSPCQPNPRDCAFIWHDPSSPSRAGPTAGTPSWALIPQLLDKFSLSGQTQMGNQGALCEFRPK